jgi:hypothetical protein
MMTGTIGLGLNKEEGHHKEKLKDYKREEEYSPQGRLS